MSDGSSDDASVVRDEDWDDWHSSGDEELDAYPAHSLFEPSRVFASPALVFEFDAAQHGFDLLGFARRAQLDDYGVLRVINYIRSAVAAGTDPRAGQEQGQGQGQEQGQLQQLLHLRRENAELKELLAVLRDAMLPEELRVEAPAVPLEGRSGGACSGSSPGGGTSTSTSGAQLPQEAVSEPLGDTAAAAAAAAGESRDGTADTGTAASSPAGDGGVAATLVPLTRPGAAGGTAKPGVGAEAGPAAPSSWSVGRSRAVHAGQVDASYYDSYSGLGIHQDMLEDKPRTTAYQRALEGNPALLRGKVVMDLGCGSGILSLFAARAGAARVVALEASQRMAMLAQQVAASNRLGAEAGGPVHVLHSRLEDLSALPEGMDKVDVLVSEWMGYGLLFESMLDSVLQARDRWLAPGGVLLPDRATLYLAGASSAALGTAFWQDVYGFDMSVIGQAVAAGRQGQPQVLVVDPAHLTTNTVELKALDLMAMLPSDQDFTTSFTLHALDGACGRNTHKRKPDPSSTSSLGGVPGPDDGVELAALVMWFDCAFSEDRCRESPVLLSTSPEAPPTHWAQVVLPLRRPIRLTASPVPGCATGVACMLSMARNAAKHRSFDIVAQLRAELDGGGVAEDVNLYAMSVLGD
ncbi:S-adenosyl-L-methionine-dependent methyltransferase [Haematococcus lacustris]